MADLDPDLVWETQRAETRAVFTRLLESWGFGATDWPYIPPMRQILELAAMMEFRADMPELPERRALREAAEVLGMEDDDDRDSEYHPADRCQHAVRDWKRDVKKARRNSPRAPSD